MANKDQRPMVVWLQRTLARLMEVLVKEIMEYKGDN